MYFIVVVPWLVHVDRKVFLGVQGASGQAERFQRILTSLRPNLQSSASQYE